MKAVVYAGPGEVRVDETDAPAIQEPGDAIVKVRQSAICGSDLGLVHGKIPGAREGATVGHEFVGTVKELGDGVSKHWEDTRVLGSFLIACGACDPCTARRFNFCVNRRALGLGEANGDLEGAQAEYVRVPDADINLRSLSGALSGLSDEEALFGGDILATAFYVSALAELGSKPVVVVIGAGPVGLLCAAAAQRRGAGRVLVTDADPTRRAFARDTMEMEVIEPGDDPVAAVAAATEGAMGDVVMECVGAVAAFKTGLKCVREGGRLVVVGAYVGERYDLALGRAWDSGLDLRFAGMANVQGYWDEALFSVAKGELDPTKLVTHRLALDDAPQGYELFASKAAMKVVLTP